MALWICEQCGAQFPESGQPPVSCPICEDERQFVNWKGQAMAHAAKNWRKAHRLVWRDDLGIPGIGLEPGFAIGQRALLIREADGCVLWDCVPLADAPKRSDYVRSLGGLKAIAVSHPHYYGAIADWSEAFGGAPVYLHGDDRQWITRPHPSIVPWSGGSHQISDDIVLVRAGGHFAGATVLHWRAGAEGRGALFTGDIAMVAMDRRHAQLHVQLSELHSARTQKPVRRIARAIEPLAFDRVYGAWWGRNIETGAKAAFDASVRRYVAAIS